MSTWKTQFVVVLLCCGARGEASAVDASRETSSFADHVLVLRATFDANRSDHSTIRVTPLPQRDTFLLTGEWIDTSVLSKSKGKQKLELPHDPHWVKHVRRIPGSDKWLLCTSDSDIYVLQSTSIVEKLTPPSGRFKGTCRDMAIAPNGELVAIVTDSALHLFSLVTCKEISCKQFGARRFYSGAFSSDATEIILDGPIQSSRKREHTFLCVPITPPTDPSSVLQPAHESHPIRSFPGSISGITRCAVARSSEDGERNIVLILDPDIGQVSARVEHTADLAHDPVISNDGRYLAAAGTDASVVVWESATLTPLLSYQLGRPFSVDPNGGVFITSIAFETTQLTAAGIDIDGTLLRDPEGAVGELIVCSWDIWTSNPALGKCGDDWWKNLLSSDAKLAHATMAAMAANPGQALEQLAKSPLTCPVGSVQQCIDNLNADEFAVREAAMNQIRQLGIHRKTLEQLSKTTQVPELRSRLGRVLAKPFSPKIENPETLARIRALQVLERLGTPEAITLIEKMSKGDQLALPTVTAKQVLDRLRLAAASNNRPRLEVPAKRHKPK